MYRILKNKKSKRALNKKSGFTLLELLLGISIFVLIMLALTLFSRNIWFYNSFISAGLNDNDAGRQAMKTMASEIRTASTANTGAYAISLATSTSFTFYSDTDNDGLKERIRYFLSGSLIKKGVIKPTGSPLTYVAGNEVLTTLVSYVTSTSIFEYYDKSYSGTEAPLSSPINIPSVRLIKISLTIDKDTSRPPSPMNFSTQISIRNLKDNL